MNVVPYIIFHTSDHLTFFLLTQMNSAAAKVMRCIIAVDVACAAVM